MKNIKFPHYKKLSDGTEYGLSEEEWQRIQEYERQKKLTPEQRTEEAFAKLQGKTFVDDPQNPNSSFFRFEKDKNGKIIFKIGKNS